MSREAKVQLVRLGVLDERDVEAIHVIDEPPADCEVLDERTEPLPLPVLLPDEVKTQNIRVAAEDDSAPPKPVRFSRLEQAVQLLKEQGRATQWDTIDWNPSEYEPLESLSKVRIPRSWRRVVSLVPADVAGRSSEEECILLSPMRVLERPGEDTAISEPCDDAPTGMVTFATTYCGDWLSFVTTSPNMPEDCPVVVWDHESSSIRRHWDTVAAFVQELVVWAQESER